MERSKCLCVGCMHCLLLQHRGRKQHRKYDQYGKCEGGCRGGHRMRHGEVVGAHFHSLSSHTLPPISSLDWMPTPPCHYHSPLRIMLLLLSLNGCTKSFCFYLIFRYWVLSFGQLFFAIFQKKRTKDDPSTYTITILHNSIALALWPLASGYLLCSSGRCVPVGWFVCVHVCVWMCTRNTFTHPFRRFPLVVSLPFANCPILSLFVVVFLLSL